jgi:hypothetical protein
VNRKQNKQVKYFIDNDWGMLDGIHEFVKELAVCSQPDIKAPTTRIITERNCTETEVRLQITVDPLYASLIRKK